MQLTSFNLIALCCISAKCLILEDSQQQRSCLLQIHQRSLLNSSKVSGGPLLNNHLPINLEQVHSRSKYSPTVGDGGNMNASLSLEVDGICTKDSYQPSWLEQNFSAHAVDWTTDKEALCDNLDSRDIWIQENMDGEMHSGEAIFSRLCIKGKAPQFIEPLAGILRDPRMICDTESDWDVGQRIASIDFLVLADAGDKQSFAKKVLFDAGGTRFMDAMQYFTSQYEKRGIELDEIYVWEEEHQGREAYWSDTPSEVREKWEPRLTFYDGVAINADPDSEDNPLQQIRTECQRDDFCAFKLDVDDPSVELPIIEQLLDSSEVAEVLDEFFFEHHVTGLMQEYGWGEDVNGTFADSYNIFTQLRHMGVRAHSWI